MNAERILELATFIESGAHAWDMSYFNTCFCGNFAAMTKQSGFEVEEWLGLNGDEGELLIMPPFYYSGEAKYTRKRAAAVLRKLAKTGKVSWPKAVSP